MDKPHAFAHTVGVPPSAQSADHLRPLHLVELALCLALGLALLVLVYRQPLAVTANAGTANPPFSGLHGPERNAVFDYAYSTGETALALPLAGGAPYLITLRLAGPAGQPVETQLIAPLAVTLGPVAAPRIYRILTPPAAGGPRLALLSETVTPPGERRALGPLVDRATLHSLGTARPDAGVAGGLALTLALLWGALLTTGVPALPRRLVLAITPLALGLLLAAARPVTDAGPLRLGALAAMLLLAAIASPPLLRRAGAWATPVVATRAGILALAALVAAGVYALTLGQGYLSDDFQLRFFARYAGPADLWAEFVPPFAASPRPGYYRPLGLLLWWLGERLGGGGVLLPHLLNVGFHAGNAALVCAIAWRLGAGQRAALGAGLIFALSPAYSESVAWLAGRFDLAATALVLLAALALLGRERPQITQNTQNVSSSGPPVPAPAAHARRGGPWLAAGLVLLALLCKESAIVAPALLLLLSAWNRVALAGEPWHAPRTWGRALAPVLPAAFVAGAYLGWRRLIFGGLGGHLVPGGADPLATVTPTAVARLAEQLATFLLAPLNWPLLLRHAWGAPVFVWLVALCLGAALAWALARRGAPPSTPHAGALGLAALGVAWAALAGLPLIGTGGWVAESFEGGRYAYLPAVGSSIALGALLGGVELLARGGKRLARVLAWQPIVYGILFALLTAATLQRGLIWGQAAERTERFVASVAALHPAPPAQTTLVLRGVPDNFKGAYALRNGLAEALRLRYEDVTLRVVEPQRPGAPTAWRPPRADRVHFLAEASGRAIPDPDAGVLAATLARRLAEERERAFEAVEATDTARAAFVNGPQLRGAALLRASGPIAAEQSLELLLVWSGPAEPELALAVELVNARGEVVAQYAGSLASHAVRAAAGRRSLVPLTLPEALREGAYVLRVGLAAPDGSRLPVAESADTWVELFPLEASSRPRLTIWR